MEHVTDASPLHLRHVTAPHHRLAKICAEARLPTLIEKPLGRNAEESEEIVRLFRKERVPLFVAFYRQVTRLHAHYERALAVALPPSRHPCHTRA